MSYVTVLCVQGILILSPLLPYIPHYNFNLLVQSIVKIERKKSCQHANIRKSIGIEFAFLLKDSNVDIL